MDFKNRPLRHGPLSLHKHSLVEAAKAHSLRNKLSALSIDAPKSKSPFGREESGPKKQKAGGDPSSAAEDPEPEANLMNDEELAKMETAGKLTKTRDQMEAEAKASAAVSEEQRGANIAKERQRRIDYDLKRQANRKVEIQELYVKDKDGSLLPSDTDVVEAMIRQIGYAVDGSVKPREIDERLPPDGQSMATKLIGVEGSRAIPLAKDDWDLVVPYDQWVGSGFLALGGRPDPSIFPEGSRVFFSRQKTVRMYFAVDEEFYLDDEEAVANVETVEGDLLADDRAQVLKDRKELTKEEHEKKESEEKRKAFVRKERAARAEQRALRSLEELEVGGGGQYELGPAPTPADKRFQGEGAEDYKQTIRRNLFQFGNDADENNKGSVTLSYNALEMQARARGSVPPVEKGSFLEECEYKKMRFQVVDGFKVRDLSDPATRKQYDRANKFRMEVGRKWWQFFTNMEGAVQREIFNRGEDEYADEEYEGGLDKQNRLDVTAAQKKAASIGPMVLAVTEIGPWGGLYPGRLDPPHKTKQVPIPGTEGTGVFTDPLYSTEYIRVDKLDAGDETAKMLDVWKREATGIANDIKIANDQTWPLVKIGKTRRWLDWVRTGIAYKNNLAYSILREFFGVRTDWKKAVEKARQEDEEGVRQQDTEDARMNVSEFTDEYTDDSNIYRTFTWRSEEGNKILEPVIRMSLYDENGQLRDPDVQDVTPALLNDWWSTVEDVFDDLIDACPFWVQSFLSADLVDDDDVKLERAAVCERFATLLTGAKVNLQVEEQQLDRMNADPQANAALLKEQKQKYEIALMNVNWYSAQQQFNDPNKDTYYMGNFVWNPYPVQLLGGTLFADQDIVNLLDKDHTGVDNLTWAHEQMLRCIVKFYSNELVVDKGIPAYIVDDYKDDNGKLIRGLLRPDGLTLTAGEQLLASHMFCNWYKEMVLKLPLGGKGQVVTCVDMIQLVFDTLIKPSATRPQSKKAKFWYCNGHGEMGVVISDFEMDAARRPMHYYDVRLFIKVPEENRADLEGYVDDDGHLILRDVPATNIWPLTFKQKFRYMDRGVIDVGQSLLKRVREGAANEARAASLEGKDKTPIKDNTLLIQLIDSKAPVVVSKTGWYGPIEDLEKMWGKPEGGKMFPKLTKDDPGAVLASKHKKLSFFRMSSEEAKQQIPPAHLTYTTFAENPSSVITTIGEATKLVVRWGTITNRLRTDPYEALWFKKTIIANWESGEALQKMQEQRALLKLAAKGAKAIERDSQRAAGSSSQTKP